MKHLFALVGVVSVFAFTSISHAELITPTGVSLDAGVTEPLAFLDPLNLINDSGLSGAATEANYTTITHGIASTGAWATIDPAPAAGDYFADTNVQPVLTFILDQTYDVTDLVVWGYHFGAPLGNMVKDMTVEFSTDGGANFYGAVNVTSGLIDLSPDTLTLGGAFAANAVRLTLTDNYFGTVPGGDRVGIGEVKFLGTVVPEPSTLMLLGLGMVCLVGYARRRKQPGFPEWH